MLRARAAGERDLAFPIEFQIAGRLKKPKISTTLDSWSRPVQYGEAAAASASWRAHDGSRQRGTACPLLYRYRLSNTYCLLARLPPTHPFVGAPIVQLHFQVQQRWQPLGDGRWAVS